MSTSSFDHASNTDSNCPWPTEQMPFNEIIRPHSTGHFNEHHTESETCSGSTMKTTNHKLVMKRNMRERRRVETVNTAFVRLRQLIPYENRGKRLSKVKTLKRAMEYIDHLRRILNEDRKLESPVSAFDERSNRVEMSPQSWSSGSNPVTPNTTWSSEDGHMDTRDVNQGQAMYGYFPTNVQRSPAESCHDPGHGCITSPAMMERSSLSHPNMSPHHHIPSYATNYPVGCHGSFAPYAHHHGNANYSAFYTPNLASRQNWTDSGIVFL